MTQLLSGQNEFFLQADQAFNDNLFDKSIALFRKYPKINQDGSALIKRGIAYYKTNQLEKAIADFTASKKLGYKDPIMYYYMGRTHHHLEDLDKASFFYKSYLKLTNNKGPFAVRCSIELKNCAFLSMHQESKKQFLVQGFGPEVNSRFDEINAIQSTNYGNLFYFSSNRNQKNFEIFAKALSDEGEWSDEPLDHKPFNNKYDNFALDVEPVKGLALVYLNAFNNLQKVNLASFDQEGNDIVIGLPDEIFKVVEDVQIVNRHTLIFSSNKLEGYGGYDIYTIQYKNQKWGTPVNLGPIVNSEFNERTPNISHNFDHLYFSSDRPYAFGGFDVYYTNPKERMAPKNMGSEINTTADELFFRLDDAGHMATFSSNNINSTGGFDLYFAYLQNVKNMGVADSLVFEYIPIMEEQAEVFDTISTKPDSLSSLITNTITVDFIEADDPDVFSSHEVSPSDNNLLNDDEKSKTVSDSAENIQNKIENQNNTSTVKDTKDDIASEVEERTDGNNVARKDPSNEPIKTDPENNVSNNSSKIIAESKTDAKEEDNKDRPLKEDEEILVSNSDLKDKSETVITHKDTTQIVKIQERQDEDLYVDIEKTTNQNNPIDSAVETTVKKPSESIKPVTKEPNANEDTNSQYTSSDQVKTNGSESHQKSTITDKYSKEVDKIAVDVLEKDAVITNEKEKPALKNKMHFESPNTIFYEDRHDILNGLNGDKLLQLVNQHKDKGFHITAHTDQYELGLPEYAYYNTFKRGLDVAMFINGLGIKGDQIIIESVANNYPLIKEEIAGKVIDSLIILNKRIEIKIFEQQKVIDQDKLLNLESVPSYAYDKKYELYKSIKEDVYYSVEIANSKRIYKNAILRLYYDIYIRRDGLHNNNKYFIGIYTNKKDAEELRDELKKSSVPYARVVKFVGGHLSN